MSKRTLRRQPAPTTEAAAPASTPAPVAAAAVNPGMLMVKVAAERGAGLDELDRYIAMAEHHDAIEREKSFTRAKVALIAEAIDLTKDRTNDDFGNAYISLGKLVKTVGPFLSKHGLSSRWDYDQSKGHELTVICVLSHVAGHSDRVALTVPRDADERKNDLQAIKSSLTYARSMTYEAVCGIAATDGNVDDDGNASGRRGPAEGEPSQLLKNARHVADQGIASLQQFWKDCNEAQRRELASHMPGLEARAASVKVPR